MRNLSFSQTISCISSLVLTAGCATSNQFTSTVVVQPDQHTFIVEARGEISPSESITVNMPQSMTMMFNILWLIPEYSEVKKGDVIARFDDSQILTEREIQLLTILNQEFLLANHARQSSIDLSQIDHELIRVDGEVVIARNFVEVDPRYFSRNEIIDAIGDLEYLGVEEEFFGWKGETHQNRSDAETSRIQTYKQNAERELHQRDEALNSMELHSPADGTFVYARTRWGEKLTKGHSVFAGRAVGLLPVRGKVHARLFVPEVDAIGIETGQKVEMRLDTDVSRKFTGRIIGMSPIATSTSRNDPRKYFIVEASIDDVDPDLMRVGSNLSAKIVVAELTDALVVPQQAVFFDANTAVVYVLEDGELQRKTVEIGIKNPTLVEIRNGLQPGDVISLIEPPNAVSS